MSTIQSYPGVTTVSSTVYSEKDEGVISKMELTKWHLKLCHPCHYLLEYLRFSLPFFNTVPLAFIKISSPDFVAASGLKTFCFQARSSYKRMMLFTSVTD